MPERSIYLWESRGYVAAMRLESNENANIMTTASFFMWITILLYILSINN